MIHIIKMVQGNKKIQYLIAYSVAVAGVAIGMFASWPSPVMPKLKNNETDIVINEVEMAWMVSMTSPGFVTGSLVTSFLADRFGRKFTLLITAIPLFIGTVIAAFTVTAWLLCVKGFLWGFGTGMIAISTSLYLAEIADKEIRGTLSLITRFMFNFGSLLIMCVGPFVSYRLLNYMLLGVPIIYFVVCLWIPESPYYYLKEGKVDDARNVLAKIRLYEDKKMLEDDLTQMRAEVKHEMRNASSAKELFTSRRYRKSIIIAGGLKMTQILTGTLVVQHYLGLIMIESGSKLELSTIFIIFGVLRFLSSVTSSIVADKIGRRPLLIYSYLGTAITLGIIGLYFFLLQDLAIDREIIKPYGFVPFAALICCNIISTVGYYSVIVLIPAEIFALNIKAVALTSLSMFGGLLHFGVARGYQVIKDSIGLSGVFWFLATWAVIGCLFSAFCVPETKGKSLKEIQILLQGDMYEYDTEETVKLNSVENGDAERKE